MNKILYVILDGLSDSPIKALKNKTPLESAYTPNMDRLAQSGASGIVYPALEDIAPESDVAVFGLLGYDPEKYYCGRGPLESFAAGLTLEDGNLALRVNFATVDTDGQVILERRVARSLSHEEADALAKEINSKVTLSNATFEFRNTIGHRGVLVIRGIRSRLCGYITNSDPAYERRGLFSVPKEEFSNRILTAVPQSGYEDSSEAQEAAGLVNEFSAKVYRVLKDCPINKKRIAEGKFPANAVLLRDAGDHLPKFVKFSELYNLNFGCFVEMPIDRGIALLTGMDIIQVPDSSGHLDVDYPVWAKVALDALQKYDGIYLHIKGPDEPGHDGDFARKKNIIEAIDKFFFPAIMQKLDLKNTILAVSSDHSTSCEKKAHTSCPVPLFVCGRGVKPDGTMSFSEKAAQLGSLGRMKSQEVMPLVVKFAAA